MSPQHRDRGRRRRPDRRLIVLGFSFDSSRVVSLAVAVLLQSVASFAGQANDEVGSVQSESVTTIAAHYASGDVRDWRQAVTNVSNLYRDESVPTGQGDLSLVVNGFGIRYLSRETPEADRTQGMIEGGVRIVACGNSMERFDIPRERLVDGVDVVESGVAELVRLQGAGGIYLKLP